MENPSDYFNSWIKMQQQAFAALQNQMQSLYQNPVNDNPFSNWSKSVFQAFPVGADAYLAKDIFGKTLNSNEAVQKLFEVWQPIFNAMRDKSMDPASYSELTDPVKVSQLVEKMFGFDTALWTQMQKQSEQYVQMLQQYGKPWTNTVGALSDFSPESMAKQMEALYAQMNQSAGKLFGVPALGKDREKIEQWSACAKAMSDFAGCNLDYQKLMQATGLEAMQSLAKILAEKTAAGEKFEKFDDFFALWIDTSEKTFNKLFYTEGFSEKRNAMTAAGFHARKLYNEIVEDQLADLPIARRSEMDEVYKLVYDLRKQVKDLNAQVQELKKEPQ